MTKQLRILIIDDVTTTRSLIKRTLFSAGFVNFVEAENGHAALQKLSQEPFQLVISGWEMPRMTGLEMLQNMRSNESHMKIPFILVTSVTEASKVVSAIQEGVDDYIIKPLKPDDFIKRVKAVLKNSQLVAVS